MRSKFSLVGKAWRKLTKSRQGKSALHRERPRTIEPLEARQLLDAGGLWPAPLDLQGFDSLDAAICRPFALPDGLYGPVAMSDGMPEADLQSASSVAQAESEAEQTALIADEGEELALATTESRVAKRDSYTTEESTPLAVPRNEGLLANDKWDLTAENWSFDLRNNFLIVPKPINDEGQATANHVRNLYRCAFGPS